MPPNKLAEKVYHAQKRAGIEDNVSFHEAKKQEKRIYFLARIYPSSNKQSVLKAQPNQNQN
jgi:hypothetical protein